MSALTVVDGDALRVVLDEPRLFRRRAWYRRRLESLERQAIVDNLTGLRNQRALWRELSLRATSGPRPGRDKLAVVMLDFDRFTEVNRTYGHAVGDAVLRRGAGILRDFAHDPRLAFRYGGEEFVVLVPGDEHDGRTVAETVSSAIARQNGVLPAITASCGVAAFDGPIEPWVALDRADVALRAAKRCGRNRVVVAGRAESNPSGYLLENFEHESARRAALALAVATLEERDRSTADHSDDVLTLCESLGRRLDFDRRKLEHLMVAAPLHDVGKVAIPSEILDKRAPLTEDEWAIIREHTVIGERILRSVPEMAEVATIVRHSHEHWDGSGYPDGLAGEEIPLASRVILCADAFHAIRCDRPYREGRSAREALKELHACAGTQFDPMVVEALAAIARDVRGHGGVVLTLPRPRRLAVLLATLTLGGGSAYAASEDVRHAVGGIKNALLPLTIVERADAGTDHFPLRPLDEAPALSATEVRNADAAVFAALDQALVEATSELRRQAEGLALARATPGAGDGTGAPSELRAHVPASENDGSGDPVPPSESPSVKPEAQDEPRLIPVSAVAVGSTPAPKVDPPNLVSPPELVSDAEPAVVTEPASAAQPVKKPVPRGNPHGEPRPPAKPPGHSPPREKEPERPPATSTPRDESPAKEKADDELPARGKADDELPAVIGDLASEAISLPAESDPASDPALLTPAAVVLEQPAADKRRGQPTTHANAGDERPGPRNTRFTPPAPVVLPPALGGGPIPNPSKTRAPQAVIRPPVEVEPPAGSSEVPSA